MSKTLNEHISKFCQVTLESLAYAGTGDVLKVQQLLAMCGEHIETEEATAWKVRCLSYAEIYQLVLPVLVGILPRRGYGLCNLLPTLPHAQSMHQGPAVIGLALVAMAEPLGSQMASRSLEHMLQYGDPSVRRAVPLAIAVLNISSPDMAAMDTLGRLSHDADSEVAQSAVLALGLVGAGRAKGAAAGLGA